MKKTFVLDTNVLLHNADAIGVFADNDVVLPIRVIEELDGFKTHGDELGRNARQVVRTLDGLRARGSLREGVALDSGGVLRVILTQVPPADPALERSLSDNLILATAYALHQGGEAVIFVSKDINARIKADALGMKAVDFEKQKVNFDELFAGYRDIELPKDKIDGFYSERSLELDELHLLPNEFVLMRDSANPKHTALGRFSTKEGAVVHLNDERNAAWDITPRSAQQRMALELLLDDEVDLVTLVGPAGTGKTLLALAAGLRRVMREKRYSKLLVTRPIVPLGRDLGYLPGGKEEKLQHWMEPIYDNMKLLLSSRRKSVRGGMDELLRSGAFEMEALTYMRGRSIPEQFVIVDEAQNLTPHEVRTVVSRAGEDTKMVLTGDPYQIDNPYLDASSNGLTYAVERLKESALVGHVTLSKSERSDLASLAASKL